MRAYVLIRVQNGVAGRIADAAGRLTGASSADCVMAGRYDVVLSVPTSDARALSRLIAEIDRMPGVERAEACIVHHPEALDAAVG